MSTSMRRLILLGVLVPVALATATAPALAKGPRIMMVYGAPLPHPVVLSNWRDNATIMFATSDAYSIAHAKLAGRPYVRVAMFWGLYWMQYMNRHKPLSAVRPGQAVQSARFYPAYGAAPALFVFDSIPGPYTSLIRRVDPAGLAVLARHGIPVRLTARG